MTTLVDGIPRERVEKWGIYTIEGIPGVGPSDALEMRSEVDEEWSFGEWVVAALGVVGLVVYGMYVASL